jgi:hypothetical protein
VKRRAATAATSLLVGASLLVACAGKGTQKVAPTTTAAPTTTTTEAPLTAGQQISFYVPRVGDCFDKRTIGVPPNTTMIHLLLPCQLPHESEVFAALDYPGPNFPGTGVLQEYAKRSCVAHFEPYVGRDYETSVYELGYDLPDQANWNNGITHVIGCLVVSATTDRLAGSARGTRR